MKDKMHASAEPLSYVGIDGCRAGWLSISLDENDYWHYQVSSKLKTLFKNFFPSSLILIDMPLGLLGRSGKHRDCDVEARALLGKPRSSSVFTPPARPTLAARDYQEAQLINRRCQGKGLSYQAWNLVPKIKELDKMYRKEAQWKGRLHEAHPELCFWALNGRKSMAHNKSTELGRSERLRVLNRYEKNSKQIVETIAKQTLRKDVAWDDIMDSLVLAVSARLGRHGLNSLPVAPPEDGYGINMEIVYADAPDKTGKTS